MLANVSQISLNVVQGLPRVVFCTLAGHTPLPPPGGIFFWQPDFVGRDERRAMGRTYEGRSKSFEPHPFKRKVDK